MPPGPDYLPVGHINREIGDGATSFGVGSTELHVCDLCGAIVAFRPVHTAWHAVQEARARL